MKVTNDELKADLIRVGDLLGKTPTGTEYEKYGTYSLFPYKSRKKWTEWCKECFEDTNIILKQVLVNNNVEELEQDLLDIYNLLNRVPSKRDYIKHGKYSVQSYIKIQSWSEWCKKIFPNIRKSNSLKISEEELEIDLKNVGDKIGHPPSIREYKENGKYSTAVYWRTKSWENWIKDVFNTDGGKVPDKISNQDLINNLREMEKRLGRVPKKKDLTIKNGSKYSINAYKRAFGNLANSLMAAEMRPGQMRNVPKETIIEEIRELYKKLGKTPTMKEYKSHTNSGYSCPTIKKLFGSWARLLIAADIPVKPARNVFKEDILVALKKWYKYNNYNTSCLEYWTIRKAGEKGEFPYNCSTISRKFKMPWEDIMKQIDDKYQTKDPFIGRHIHIGKDGNKYLSAIEKKVGDYLFFLKENGLISNYEYEKPVCSDKSWTCDFYVISYKNFWIEIDGMNNNRKYPYNSGENEKIQYYKENGFNYIIVSYRDIDVCNKIKEEIL